MTDGLLLVPPFIKYTAGPMLGPAMLAGAAADHGLQLDVLDLNAQYLADRGAGRGEPVEPSIYGDHRKPSPWLAIVENAFFERLRSLLGPSIALAGRLRVPAAAFLGYDHDTIDAAAERLADGQEGEWIATLLRAVEQPRVLGVSAMFSVQVVWGLAASIVAKRLWPDIPVVWGGAHVTALAEEISKDSRYGRRIDGFVAGYAEHTMVEILAAARHSTDFPTACFRAGNGKAMRAVDDAAALPRYDNLALYDADLLTLPAQVSRGCAYGRCTFCTYPRIEGEYRSTLTPAFARVVETAAAAGAALSLKDSLLTPPVLAELASLIDGRVHWSGCTKLNPGLPGALLALGEAGCRTLELGIESFVPHSQHLAQKTQSFELFERVLDAASESKAALVINYMTGFPGEDAGEAAFWLDRVRAAIAARTRLHARLEHNEFELERLAPLASSSSVDVLTTWPWSSLLDWRERPSARNERRAFAAGVPA